MAKKAKTAKTVSLGGRPTDFKNQYCEQARKLYLLGYTDIQVGAFFEVSERTINNWKKKYPKFFQAMKAGKAIANADVADGLYKRATGFSHTDTTGSVKYFPPDVQACVFWLKNREPLIWRDIQDHKVEGEVRTVPINKARLIAIKKALQDEC